MRPEIKKHMDWLEGVPILAKAMLREALSEPELIDLVGQMKSTQDRLYEERKLVESEMISGIHGERWSFTQGNKFTKSYNDDSLFGKFHAALENESLERDLTPWSFVDTIFWLIKRDALRMNWQYKNLKAVADYLDIPITEVAHEIEAGDMESDIGRVKGKASPQYDAVEPRQEGVLG